MNERMEMPPVVQALGGIFYKHGFRLFMVGGFVRNGLLHLPFSDMDVCSAALPGDAAALLRTEGVKIIEKAVEFGTIEVHFTFEGEKYIFEHTTFRRDFYDEGGSHRPRHVVFTNDMREDAIRRDFTVNALYADAITGEVLDVTGRGLAYLAQGVIAAAHEDPFETLKDDGLRLMRLVRFACEFGFTIQPELFRTAQENASLLADISAERIRAELVKIMLSDTRHPGRTEGQMPHRTGMLLLQEIGLLQYIFPELLEGIGKRQNSRYHAHDVFMHSVEAYAAAPPDLHCRLAALLHDTGKPPAMQAQGNMYGHELIGAEIARRELSRLTFDNRTIDTVAALIKHHMFDLQNQARPSTVRKKVAEMGPELFRKLIALRRADFIGSGKPLAAVESADKWQCILDEMLAENTPFRESDLAITGSDIMSLLQIEEGTLVGQIKKRLLRLCVLKPSQNTRVLLLRHAQCVYREILRQNRLQSR